MAERTVVLYDADCGFCRWSLAALLRLDRHRRLRPVAVQTEEARRLLAGMSEEQRMASAHAVTPDGRVLSGGAAAPEVLELLPAGTPLAAVTRALPGLTDRGYRFVAGHRDWWGRLVRPGAAARARRLIDERSD